MPQHLSVIIHIQNAALTLPTTLSSIKRLADEIVVIDMHSTDKTVEIAKKAHAQVYSVKNVGYADPFREFGLNKATKDWILVIDADEEINSSKLLELVEDIKNETVPLHLKADSYWIPRKNLIWTHWIKEGGWWPDYQLRLFKRGSVTWPPEVHGKPQVIGTSLSLPPEAAYCLTHHHYQTVEQYLERLNRYTSLELHKNDNDQINSSLLLTTFFSEFNRRLFAQKGIEGSSYEVGLGLMQGLYQVVVKLKRAQAEGFPLHPQAAPDLFETINSWYRDYCYWRADYFANHTSGMTRLWWKCRRKFKW